MDHPTKTFEVVPVSDRDNLDPPTSDDEEFGDISGDKDEEVDSGDVQVEAGDKDTQVEAVTNNKKMQVTKTNKLMVMVMKTNKLMLGIEEETCRDLSIFFGEDARIDDCEAEEDIGDEYAWDEDKIPDPVSSDEENEEEMRPSEAYREDVDPEELLQLGKTFFDANDF